MSRTSTALVARRRSRLAERGAVSAEYALVTAAIVSFGAILVAIFNDDKVRQALLELILRIFQIVADKI